MTKGQADRLQRLQNRAARVITKSDYSIRSVEVLRQLQWDNLELRRFKHMAIQMYTIFNHKALKYLYNFEKVCDSTHYNLRGHDINSCQKLGLNTNEIVSCLKGSRSGTPFLRVLETPSL